MLQGSETPRRNLLRIPERLHPRCQVKRGLSVLGRHYIFLPWGPKQSSKRRPESFEVRIASLQVHHRAPYVNREGSVRHPRHLGTRLPDSKMLQERGAAIPR
jgi:hypothetical protein